MDDQDDTVIDLAAYVRRKEAEAGGEESPTTFTLWGGEGERSRFALPLWRAAYLASGRRSALLWLRKDVPEEEPEPLIVLDLREEKARLDFTPASVLGLAGATKPGTFAATAGGLAVYLGEDNDRKWYLTVDDLEGVTDLPLRPQNDLLFLAGECAGLLFFRGLAVGVDGWEGNERP